MGCTVVIDYIGGAVYVAAGYMRRFDLIRSQLSDCQGCLRVASLTPRILSCCESIFCCVSLGLFLVRSACRY